MVHLGVLYLNFACSSSTIPERWSAFLQKSRKLIFGSISFPELRPLPLPRPRPRPLPLPLEPLPLKNDFPCFISRSEWRNSSQRMHPTNNVAPPSNGVVFLLKSTSIIVESHSAHFSFVVAILWAPWGRKTRQLHLLQLSFQLGAPTGSSTSVPLHSGQAQTPWVIKECRHVGCGHRKHGMPIPLLDAPELGLVLAAPYNVSIPSNGGLL